MWRMGAWSLNSLMTLELPMEVRDLVHGRSRASDIGVSLLWFCSEHAVTARMSAWANLLQAPPTQTTDIVE